MMKNIQFRKIFILAGIAMLYSQGLLAQSAGNVHPEFESIFNGKDLKGWVTSTQAKGVQVKDGELISKGKNAPKILHARKNLGNYVLRFEYMLSENGDSGVMLRYDEEDPRSSGLEIPLKSPDKGKPNPLKSTGSIYNLVAVTNLPDANPGEWHDMEIVCDRKQILVAVDGRLTTWVDTDNIRGFEEKQLQGMLGFQGNNAGEDQWVRFRNIRIKNLDLNPEYVLEGFYREDGIVRKQAHGQAVALNLSMVEPLCNTLDHENIKVSAGSRKTLREIIARASDPDGNTRLRNELKQKLQSYHTEMESKYAKQFLGQQLKLLE